MINAILKKGSEDVTLEDEVTLSQRNAADRTKNEGVHIRTVGVGSGEWRIP